MQTSGIRMAKKPAICTARRAVSARGRSLPPTRLMTRARLSEHQQISVACHGKALYVLFPRIAAPWIMLPVKKALAANAVCQPRTANHPADPLIVSNPEPSPHKTETDL